MFTDGIQWSTYDLFVLQMNASIIYFEPRAGSLGTLSPIWHYLHYADMSQAKHSRVLYLTVLPPSLSHVVIVQTKQTTILHWLYCMFSPWIFCLIKRALCWQKQHNETTNNNPPFAFGDMSLLLSSYVFRELCVVSPVAPDYSCCCSLF